MADTFASGFETVADSVKKVYNKVRGDHESSNEELNERNNPKDDAEWLPWRNKKPSLVVQYFQILVNTQTDQNYETKNVHFVQSKHKYNP